MIGSFVSKVIEESFGFEPTQGQKEVINMLADFVSGGKSDDEIFLLKGYAGTGKTTLISALIKSFKKLKQKSLLLAPTGRAAKVLSNYSGKPAYTIHKKIYRQKSSSDGMGKFTLDDNLHTNTFFIVDEASMIANQTYENAVFGSGRLLDDLIEFIYNEKRCKLIIIGDTAQLPPVGLSISPALDIDVLRQYDKEVYQYELTEVVRQKQNSGILENATNLRNIIKEKHDNNIFNNQKLSYPYFDIENFKDIQKISGADLIEKISDAYDKYSELGTAIICRSNKRANRYNQGIRNTILFREDEISTGDLIMIVKNNYYWAEDYDEIDFIANGDTATIVRIKKYTEMYGFRFADVTLKFSDYIDLELDAKILIDTLHTETASLSSEQNKELFYKISEDYQEIGNKRTRYKKVRENEYFNALQVKFAYAITCHKAQGGQWDKVFLDQGWLKEDMIDVEYLRWLYTAFTRASGELSLVNFNKEFFRIKSN